MSHYHFGGRQNDVQLVTRGADGDRVQEVDTLADRNEYNLRSSQPNGKQLSLNQDNKCAFLCLEYGLKPNEMLAKAQF